MILNLISERKNEMERPDPRKAPMSVVGDYIEMLEKRIVELGEEIETLTSEIDTSKERERLTDLWARGEIEN